MLDHTIYLFNSLVLQVHHSARIWSFIVPVIYSPYSNLISTTVRVFLMRCYSPFVQFLWKGVLDFGKCLVIYFG
jgi:hypothetical protein